MCVGAGGDRWVESVCGAVAFVELGKIVFDEDGNGESSASQDIYLRKKERGNVIVTAKKPRNR